jgi:hypothetical protein
MNMYIYIYAYTYIGQLMKRLKAADLELTEDDCPSRTITWLSSDPEDPLIGIFIDIYLYMCVYIHIYIYI